MADGIDIVVAGANFQRFVDVVAYPIADPSSLFFLGGDAASSKINQGSGANATGTAASVTYHDGYASFSGSHSSNANYLQTSDADDASNDVTYISVHRRTVDGLRGIWGVYAGSGDGSGIYSSGGFCAGAGSLVTAALGVNEITDDFLFQAAVIEGTTLRTFTGLDGVLVPGDVTTIVREGSASTARIGGAYSGTSAGSVDIHAVSKHLEAVTAVDLLAAYTYLRSRAAKIGDITIL